MFELTKAQKEFLVYEAELPGTNVNTLCANIDLGDKYPSELIADAVNLFYQYEQSTRLRICCRDGEYFQYEVEYVKQDIPTIGYDSLSSKHVFDIFDAPLIKCQIMQTASSSHVVILVHHLIGDGYSLVLAGAKIANYCEYLSGRSEASPVERRFTDCIERENLALCSPRHDHDRQYWKDLFRDWSGACFLSHNRENKEQPHGARMDIPLTDGLTEKVIKHCEERNISAGIMFETALLLYLHFLNPDKKRVDIGQNQHGRNTLAEMDTFGPYVAERLICVYIDPQDTIDELYEKVSQATASSNYHGLCLHDEVLEIVRKMHPEAQCIRDVEFSFLTSRNPESKVTYQWLSNDMPEITAEITLEHLNMKGDMHLLMDYRTDILTIQQVTTICDTIIGFVSQFLLSTVTTVAEVKICGK